MFQQRKLICFGVAMSLVLWLSSMMAAGADLAIVPNPVSITPGDGEFVLKRDTALLVEKGSLGAEQVGEYLQTILSPAMGYTLNITESSNSSIVSNAILLTTKKADASLGDEGYELHVTGKGIAIRAPKPAGLFYGVQTLRQLLPSAVFRNRPGEEEMIWSVPSVTVRDRPRFTWRGMHFDPARHFYGKEYVKRYIDFLAMHKINILHIHLTDDQGWRLEIKQYPKLIEVGAWRKETVDRNWIPDGRVHGGYYTQDEMRELIKYAQDRFITIVPEIELPGHAQAAVSAYPELSCTGGPHEVWTRWGISENVYCAGNEDTMVFLENILSEVSVLFPSEFIHIGGDECPKSRWKECSKCRQRIKDLKLKDEHELQSYVVQRMEKLLNSKGKRLIGWDEILEGGLAPNATVMSWRGTEGGIAAAKAGHDVVMTPNGLTYFNYKEVQDSFGPGHNGDLTMEKVYSLEPVPAELSPGRQKHILGAQACLWTEYIPTPSDVEYMLLPRLSAMAEVVWTQKEGKNWGDFQTRMAKQYKRYEAMGAAYRPQP